MKSDWHNQSKARKILSLILLVFLLALSVAATFYTSLLINKMTIKEPGKSLLILLGVFVLGLVAIILMVNFYEILIMRTMTAFSCRPPKENKQKTLETKTQELKDEKIEISEQSNIDKKQKKQKLKVLTRKNTLMAKKMTLSQHQEDLIHCLVLYIYL